jgi:hypothetical protein
MSELSTMLSVKKSSLGRFLPSDALCPWWCWAEFPVNSGLFSLFRDMARRVAREECWGVAYYLDQSSEAICRNIIRSVLVVQAPTAAGLGAMGDCDGSTNKRPDMEQFESAMQAKIRGMRLAA